ncbi:hypothetical protein [Nostocoides jenkinsii]|uniref:Elongation factor Tu n=1 Tax=Nostocoides jenkinsii Ben 74 TaxID=1193518 RepID=A0A077MF04_9MICO|nr:hypothetical protein [Tetrasphaera jenkinsii]CCI53667.1 Elongation factor Tu [Tetrasphaera jenkinsii Ben 74]
MTTDTPTPEPTGRRSRIGTKTALGAAGAAAAVAAGFGISAAVADTPSPSGSASGSSSASPSGSATTAPGMKGGGMNGGGMGMRHGGPDGFGRGPGHGPGMGGFGMGRGLDTAALATKLGVTEDKLTAALQKVGQSMRDQSMSDQDDKAEDGTRTPPTQAEMDARQQAFAAALAKVLGIDQAKVTAAFDALRAEREAARKAELSSRLDAAVKAGKLTDADKQSILKGFDAGVLGGPQRD